MSIVALEDRGLRPDDGPVLVTGASGGVGRFAIQLAHLGGAEVTAMVSSGSSRAGGLRQLGADDVVSDVDQLRGRFDLILESV